MTFRWKRSCRYFLVKSRSLHSRRFDTFHKFRINYRAFFPIWHSKNSVQNSARNINSLSCIIIRNFDISLNRMRIEERFRAEIWSSLLVRGSNIARIIESQHINREMTSREIVSGPACSSESRSANLSIWEAGRGGEGYAAPQQHRIVVYDI